MPGNCTDAKCEGVGCYAGNCFNQLTADQEERRFALWPS